MASRGFPLSLQIPPCVVLVLRCFFACRAGDTDILDSVFVSRPEDLSDLEDILPSLDDVLHSQADFASDSELPMWDSMLSQLSCPGLQSLSAQTAAQDHSQELGSQKGAVSATLAQHPSPSNSACSCDVFHATASQAYSQQAVSESILAQAMQQPQQQQQPVLCAPEEPTSSRDSNPGVSSPAESAHDKTGSAKKRKMDYSDEDCSGRHPSPTSAMTQVLKCGPHHWPCYVSRYTVDIHSVAGRVMRHPTIWASDTSERYHS